MINVKVKYLDEDAKKFGLPFYRHNGDAGMDLHVIVPEEERKHGLVIYPGERKLVASGIALALPENVWARIVHRSSTEKRLRLRVIEGTIDNGYRGPIFTQVVNENSYPINIDHGDRIAQIVLCPIVRHQCEEVSELPPSDRGSNGFGSTGKK
jgi:dUTP pyrophosphatase